MPHEQNFLSAQQEQTIQCPADENHSPNQTLGTVMLKQQQIIMMGSFAINTE